MTRESASEPGAPVQDVARRPYRSTVREQRATQTRDQILAAARALFEDGGVAATTIAAIAARAGVAPQTIYAVFGSKANLAAALLQQVEESIDAARWRDRIAAEADPAGILTAFAHWTAAFFDSTSVPFLAPESITPELRELAAQGDAHRRDAITALVDRLAAAAALRDGLTRREAVDRIWMLTGLDGYRNAVHGCGWTSDRFASWLSQTLAQQVLPPSGAEG